MSSLMLDDKNTMDDMNPFVDFMPGSSRQPHAFGKYTEPGDEPEEKPYKSPACNVHLIKIQSFQCPVRVDNRVR